MVCGRLSKWHHQHLRLPCAQRCQILKGSWRGRDSDLYCDYWPAEVLEGVCFSIMTICSCPHSHVGKHGNGRRYSELSKINRPTAWHDDALCSLNSHPRESADLRNSQTQQVFSKFKSSLPPIAGRWHSGKRGLTSRPCLRRDRALFTWLKTSLDQHRFIVAQSALSSSLEIRHRNFCRMKPKDQVGGHIKQRPSIHHVTLGTRRAQRMLVCKNKFNCQLQDYKHLKILARGR